MLNNKIIFCCPKLICSNFFLEKQEYVTDVAIYYYTFWLYRKKDEIINQFLNLCFLDK